jgi:homocysteine S-methyltransferase
MNRKTKTAFAAAVGEQRPIILDGGLATQLETQGCDISNALWSASLLKIDTQAIVDASRAYLDAGAECIATASYQASRDGFATLGIAANEADALMLLSVELAERARDAYLRDNANCAYMPMIAASIGPYGAALHDGSEYTGRYRVSENELRAFHIDRLSLLDSSGADVLALETVPSIMEARLLSELLRDCATPAWVSFSCCDQKHICDGTRIETAVGVFRGHPTVLAVGVNCTSPQYLPPLIRAIRSTLPDIAILAYPNSGETYNVTNNTWSGTVSPLDCATAALTWVFAGATLVGGCCRMGPEHISAMAKRLREANL